MYEGGEKDLRTDYNFLALVYTRIIWPMQVHWGTYQKGEYSIKDSKLVALDILSAPL